MSTELAITAVTQTLRRLLEEGVAGKWGTDVLTGDLTKERFITSLPLHKVRETHAADRLEQIAGVAVRHLAYPYGSIDPAAIAKARSRFRTAVTAACRPVYRDSDPHMLGRIDAHDLHVAARLHLLGSIALTPYLGARRGLRALLR